MKISFTFLLVLFTLSGLFAQTASDCTVKIVFGMNKTMPPSYTFSIDPKTEGARYLWSFGDNTSADSPAPTHIFKVTGTYEVKVKVTKDGKDCYGVVKALFETGTMVATTLSGKGKVKKIANAACDLLIGLNSGPTLIPAVMVTDFILKEGQYVEFTYEKLATKITSCPEGTEVKIISIKEIPIVPVCKAYFTGKQSIADPAVTKKMEFANLSTGDIKECKWNFGDNTTSTDLKPTHVYAATGEYKVCLTITTLAGCTSDYCATVKVEPFPVVSPCKFDISVKPKEATPNTFKFSIYSSAVINTVKWTFGDGQSSELKETEHAYEKAGTYEVTCVVGTTAGCTETRTVKLIVQSAPLPNCTGAINLTLFDPTNNTCNGKATVKLLDISGAEIANVKYIWSDNRTTSTVENLCPDKVYTVQAVIEGNCQKSYSFSFLSKPIWRATTINGQNKFAVIEPKEGVSYEWDFGNGMVLKGADVTVNFEKDGIYDVKLTATNGTASSEFVQQVVVMKSVTGMDIVTKSELKIYPNPVYDLLNIDFGNPVQGNMQIEIMNITGKKALSEQLNSRGLDRVSFNVQKLNPGIYFMRITSGKLLIADRKFLKAR